MTDTSTTEQLDRVESSSSTTVTVTKEEVEESAESAPFYDINPGTGIAEYDASKPSRIRFKVQLVKD
jgi:hypothetical protein